MKNSKKLKLIFQILICILIILIGMVGIYTKQSNMYKNLLPHKYALASDINETTILEFEVDDTKEKVYYDKDGKEVDASTVTDKNKKDYEEKEFPVNAQENLNSNNYNESANIMKKRLKLLGVDQYQLDLDEQTGKVLLTVEDDYIEDILSILPMEGKLQLVDSNTEDVIIDYTDFKSAESSYASLRKGYTTYISLKLKDSGIEKINNIDKYKTILETTEEKKEESEESKESKLIVMFDNDKIAEVSYGDILLNRKTLRVTTGSGLTEDTKINSQINLDAIATKLANFGKMPVIYNATAQEIVVYEVENTVNYIVIILISICVILSLILIFKHKIKGLLAVLGFATNIAIFLFVIRLTNIQISLNGFAGFIGLIILNTILINNILKAIKNKDKVFLDNIKAGFLRTADAIVIMLIIFMIFTFSSMTVINSMGLLLFWGWITTIFGTLIFTVPMLATISNK